MLRWSPLAVASSVAAPGLLAGCVLPPRRGDDVSPANLELVTLTEDRAVITWYTGLTGTDDGLGRMIPAPADGEVHWGTRADRIRHVTGSGHAAAYHAVKLPALHPAQTYYYRSFSIGKPVPRTPFTLVDGNAVGTSN